MKRRRRRFGFDVSLEAEESREFGGRWFKLLVSQRLSFKVRQKRCSLFVFRFWFCSLWWVKCEREMFRVAWTLFLYTKTSFLHVKPCSFSDEAPDSIVCDSGIDSQRVDPKEPVHSHIPISRVWHWCDAWVAKSGKSAVQRSSEVRV